MTTLLAFKIIARIQVPYYGMIKELWKEAFADTPLPEKESLKKFLLNSPNYDATDYQKAGQILSDAACEYLTRKIDAKK